MADLATESGDSPPPVVDVTKDKENSPKRNAHWITKLFAKRRIVWFLVMFIGFTGVLVHLGIQTMFYFEDRRYIDMKVSTKEFEFPDLTFCRIHRYNFMKYFTEVYKADHGQLLLNGALIMRIYSAWNTVQLHKDDDIIDLVDRSMRRDAFEYNLYEYPVAEVVDCWLNGNECSFKEFTVEKHPDFFLCYTYTNFTTPDIGFYPGLRIFLSNFEKIFNSQLKDIEQEPRSYLVSLHARGTRPDFIKQTIYLSTEMVNLVDIEEERVVKLNHRDYPCIEDRGTVTYTVDFSTGETRTFRAIRDDCVIVRKQEYIFRECGCVDSEFYVPHVLGHQPLCHQLPNKYTYFATNITPSPVLNPNFDTATEIIKDGVVERYNCHRNVTIFLRDNPEVLGTCLPDCVTQTYQFIHQKESPTYKISQYRRQYISKQKERYPELFEPSNYGSTYPLYVRLFSSTMKVTIMKEMWAYTLKSYLSDVGGILGLWVGVSFITLFDIVDRFIHQYISKKRKWKLQRSKRQASMASVTSDEPENTV